MADLTPTPQERIRIHEGIMWKDSDGHAFQTWEVYEEVIKERDRLREALVRVDDFLASHDPDLGHVGPVSVSDQRRYIDHALGRVLIR